MPSSEQVQKNGGVEVSRIQAKFLEKIEELTLHVIRLEKDNQLLKSALKSQPQNQQGE
ncbi:MAG: hypothetical protein JNL32_03555 [Candidatus Kapabacteria bacterium]|nr:hypothetical protein [Candidatus Kapabacteria bacterium]